MKTQENGRSMVEMLGVLAIIGVLSAGGLAGYSKAMFKHRLNSTIDQITMLATAIRTHYGEQGNYKGISNEKALKLGIVPAAMNNHGGTTLVSPFNGTVTIAESLAKSTDTAGSATAFTLYFASLPQEACIALASADFGAGAGSGFIGVNASSAASVASSAYVGTGVAGTGTPATGGRAEGVAYSVKEAASACGNHSNNSIIWKFY